MKLVISRINRGPRSFDFRDQTLTLYAAPVGYYGVEGHLPIPAILQRLASRLHSVLYAGRTLWKTRATTMTLAAHGHLIDPWQATRYRAVIVLRRLLQKRDSLQKLFTRTLSAALNNPERAEQAHGPVT
eukprot:9481829-Pyramimonas_sp.AAC.1